MPHLHAVPLDQGDAIAAANRVHTLVCANQLAEDAERFTDDVRTAHADLDGSDLVALRDRLTETADYITEARRMIDQAGHDWIAANGNRGRADIDGVTYQAKITGSATSLKVDDKARLTNDFFRKHLTPRVAEDVITPWLTQMTNLDAADLGEEAKLTAELLLSLILEKLPFTLDPKQTVLRDEWGIDIATYKTPSTGAGPRPTFEKAPTTKEKHP